MPFQLYKIVVAALLVSTASAQPSSFPGMLAQPSSLRTAPNGRPQLTRPPLPRTDEEEEEARPPLPRSGSSCLDGIPAANGRNRFHEVHECFRAAYLAALTEGNQGAIRTFRRAAEMAAEVGRQGHMGTGLLIRALRRI